MKIFHIEANEQLGVMRRHHSMLIHAESFAEARKLAEAEMHGKITKVCAVTNENEKACILTDDVITV